MALIDLKTNLKSLKYGRDTVDGGNSKQPLVQTPIPESFSEIGNTGGFDSTFRGGALIGTALRNDELRIGKLLNTFRVPQGAAFKAKMNLLSNINVKTQVDTRKYNQGEYQTRNTVAQVAADVFGTHLPLFSGPLSYFDAVKSQQSGDQATGRLIDFYNNKINIKAEGTELYSYTGGPGSNRGAGDTIINLAGNRTGRNNPKLINFYGDEGRTKRNPVYDELRSLGVDSLVGPTVGNLLLASEPEFLADPLTGQGYAAFKRTPITSLSTTVWASGVTNLLYNSSTNQAPNQLKLEYQKLTAESKLPTDNQGVLSNPNSILSDRTSIPYLFSQAELYTANLVVGKNTADSFTDFRKRIKGKPESKNLSLAYSDYTKFSRASTADGDTYGLRIGNPGTRNSTIGGIDRSVDPATVSGSNAATTDWINYSDIGTDAKAALADNDFIPFYVSILKYDGSRDTIQFRAFVKGFSDDYSADWKAYKYLGRGEDFYNYNGFSRSIKLSFTVHAQTKGELLKQYQKLNVLAASLTPDYSGAGIMRGNFMELTFGDYIVQTPGILRAISFSIPDNSPYEIGRDREGNPSQAGNRLAHIIEVGTFDFVPIHSFLPRRTSKYISLGENNVGWGINPKTGQNESQSDTTPQETQGGEQGSSAGQIDQAKSAAENATVQKWLESDSNVDSSNQGTSDWVSWDDPQGRDYGWED